MNEKEYALLHLAAGRLNHTFKEKDIPCIAMVRKIYLDLGAGWQDYTVIIQDLNRVDDICGSCQIDFVDRDSIMAGDVDVAVKRILGYHIVKSTKDKR